LKEEKLKKCRLYGQTLFSDANMLIKSNQGIMFRPYKYDYTLRELGDNGINEKYIVDFGKFSLNKEKINNLIHNGNLNGTSK